LYAYIANRTWPTWPWLRSKGPFTSLYHTAYDENTKIGLQFENRKKKIDEKIYCYKVIYSFSILTICQFLKSEYY
jgi:hypothetical protein